MSRGGDRAWSVECVYVWSVSGDGNRDGWVVQMRKKSREMLLMHFHLALEKGRAQEESVYFDCMHQRTMLLAMHKKQVEIIDYESRV